jgi:hypothetical protein
MSSVVTRPLRSETRLVPAAVVAISNLHLVAKAVVALRAALLTISPGMFLP